MIERYLLIPADLDVDPYWIECDSEHLLSSMKQYMNCDSVECAYRSIGLRTLVFVVDDCGKLCDPPWHLNLRATLLYANSRDFLVGDVVIGCIGIRDGDADLVPLDDLCQFFVSDSLFIPIDDLEVRSC